MFINSHPSPPLFRIHHTPTWTCPRRPGLCLFRCPDRFSPRCQPLPGGLTLPDPPRRASHDPREAPGPELPPQPAPRGPTLRVSMSLPEAKDATPLALAGTGSHPRGPNTPRMPLGCRTVPGAAPARPAPWAGEEGPRPGGAGGRLRACGHPPNHTHTGILCPSAPAPARSHLWDSHQPGVTGLGPEAAPSTCRTSASGGTALRRPLPALSPRLRTGG